MLDRIEVMLLRLGLLSDGELRGVLGRFLLHATCLERKRELINARERQQHRDEFNKTFTLHLLEKNLLLFVVIQSLRTIARKDRKKELKIGN